MPKTQYTSKKFSGPTLDIIDSANNIIEEYEADGLDLTLRQLYYQFVSRDLLSNTQKSYNRLGRIISDARLAGLVDWGAIKDRGRNLRENQHWENPGQIIRAAARGFQIDHWKGQEFRPEVWIEKEALVGVIGSVCEDLDVSYFACKGYVSQSAMWEAAQRFDKYHNEGQTPVIIHLGDHDPSGIDMTRDILDRQEILRGCYSVERIALNMDQIEDYKPPPNPAKLTDSRCNGYVEKYGSNSWELDALEPRTLRELIKRTVLGFRDDSIYEDVREKEYGYLDILRHIEENWQSL